MSKNNFLLHRSSNFTRTAVAIFGVILLITPLVISLIWGTTFENTNYGSYQAARVLVTQGIDVLDQGAIKHAPLFILFLARSHPHSPTIGLIFSAIGWSAAALIVLYTLSKLDKFFAGLVAALLLVISPVIITTSGTAFSWTIALGWAVFAMGLVPKSSPLKRWDFVKSAILILLLALQYDAGTVLFALTYLIMERYERRVGWLPIFLVGTFTIAWGLFAYQFIASTPNIFPLYWLREIPQVFLEHGQYWLIVPFVLAGLVNVWKWDSNKDPEQIAQSRLPISRGQQLFALLLLWSGVAIIIDSSLTIATISVTTVALAGLGAEWIINQILDYDLLHLDKENADSVLMLIFFICLILFQSILLWQRFAVRSDAGIELEARAVEWLQENSMPEAVIFGSPRIGYQAERLTIPAQIERVTETNVSDLHTLLFEKTPDYIVSDQSFSWDFVVHSGWFKERYAPIKILNNAYATNSPITIWEFEPTPYLIGENENVEALIDDNFALVSHRFEPQVINPGDDVYLTLNLRAVTPVENGFITTIHLKAHDGWVWSYRDEQTPRSMPGSWWQPGQVIPEHFQLEIPDDLPMGAYSVEVFWHAANEDDHWPVYRGDDDEVFDRVQLGYIVAPPLVDMENAKPVEAEFSDNILLKAVEFDTVTPGELFEVILYWDTQQPPDANYTVFVGLMDDRGEAITIHNGMPLDNKFPTKAFKPGVVVRDSHMLEISPDLPLDSYQLFVGLYLLETGERLPVRSVDGDEPADRVLRLSEVDVNRGTTN